MSDDQQQPDATGQLTFPTGGVISVEQPPVLEPRPAAFTMPHQLGTAPSGAANPGAAWSRSPSAEQAMHKMPSGHTVTCMPLESLTRADRTRFIAMNRTMAEDPDRGVKLLDAILTRIIVSWTYPWPIPAQDAGALEQLPIADAWAMEKLALRADKLLFVGEITPDDHADPASPTAPSGE